MADMKFGPEWLRALSDGNSVTSPPPSPGLVMPKYKLAEHRYGREEMLVLFTSVEKIPELLQEFPSIVSEKVLQPMSYISPSEEEQRLLSSSVNSSVVLRMMGGARGSAPPIRGRGTSIGPDRGRGRGRGRGDGGFYRDFDEDGFRSVRHGRGPSWGEEGRGFGSRGRFDEPITSPRREFSRSMSSENWREAKRSGGSETREEQDDGEGDWRRAGPRERWSRNWREPHDRGFDRDFSDRGRYYDDYDRDRQRGFDRPRTYSRSKSYDDEGDLPEWSTADADDIECVGTFDSSGAFMSMKDAAGLEDDKIDVDSNDKPSEKEDGREESPRSEKNSDSNRKESKGSSPKESNKIKEAKEPKTKTKKQPTETEDSGKSKVHPGKDSKKTEQSEAIEAKKTEIPVVNGDDIPISAKPKSSSVNSSSSGSNKNKLKEEKRDSSVKKLAENRNAVPRPDPGNDTSTSPEVNADVQKEDLELKVEGKVEMLPEERVAVVDSEKVAATAVQQKNDKTGMVVTEPDEFDHLEKAAEDLMATWTAEEDEKSDRQAAVESGGVPMNHEDAKKWFYKDPQGDLQGPFTSTEMAEWFSAGYFTMNLLVKRGCDDIFQPLGELIKRWGRVPFLSGPTPPPLKSPVSTPTGGGLPTASVMQAVPNTMPPAPMSVTPPVPAGPGMEQALQQQFILQQQQALLRQLQMQQLMQVLQQQEGFAKLSAVQQQQLCMQLFLKQQQHHLMQQQQAAAAAGGNPAAALPQQASTAAPQNLSPRSGSVEPQAPGGGGQPVSMAGPNPTGHPAYQRSTSQPGGEIPVNWSSDTSPATSGNWTPQPTSVWDIEPPKSQAQSSEEIQRIEIERQRRLHEAEEPELRRKEEEKQREEEMRRREEEMRRREEERIKVEIERQKEQLRREQEEEVLRRLKEEEARRQREEEEARMRELREEEERRRQEHERRRQEEIRRRQEEEIRRQQELQRQAEEERKRKEQEELERKRLDEIRRRQEKAEELKRQQAEAIRRMQQEQMADMQLPSHAQWANSSGANSINNGPTLAEIQKVEAEKAERERVEEEKQKLIELQRQQLAAIQQQQAEQQRSWAAQKSMMNPQAGAPSLLEIQQEQARQLEEKHRQQQQQVQQTKAKLPLGAAAAWGSVTSANWAQEGAWGNMQKQTAGFWDDAIGATGKKTSQNNNASFPQLNTGGATAAAAKPTKAKTARTTKDQEVVQRLFQETKPKDEFTQWCENSLKGLQTNIDVPTFIGFLQDVESPYEVHDYVRVYLGESKDAAEFAKQFIERRSRYKNKLRQDQQEELIWGPAPAINPLAKQQQAPKTQIHHNNNGTDAEANKKQQKKKGKMQKIDASALLGFTVHAGDRVNMGEIDSIDG